MGQLYRRLRSIHLYDQERQQNGLWMSCLLHTSSIYRNSRETISLLKEEGIEVQDELARELSSNTHIMEEV